MKLESKVFAGGQPIPRRYTCDGEDVSPPLTWRNPPRDAKAFVLLVEDPDAPGGNFIHWLLYNLPGTEESLPEGVPAGDRLPGGGLQGKNDFGKAGYGGPCPPRGRPHRYVFTLFALSTPVDLRAGATKLQVFDQMKNKTLAQAELTGSYGR